MAKLRFRMFKAGNAGKSQATEARCTAKKRVKDSEWFKDKMLLAQAREAGVMLHEEQQDFLADRLEQNDDCDDIYLHTTTNFKAEHVDAYDLDFTLTYDSNRLSEVPHYDTYHDDVLNFVVQEMKYNEYSVSHADSYAKLMSDSISYAEYMVTIQDEADNYVPPLVQNKDMMLSFLVKCRHRYAVSSLMDMAYRMIKGGNIQPENWLQLWTLGDSPHNIQGMLHTHTRPHGYTVSSLMDTAYWSLE
ncbi:hypothetical protein Tco_0516548 [Tanacetum coccineum]